MLIEKERWDLMEAACRKKQTIKEMKYMFRFE